MVIALLPALRSMQNQLMTDVIDIYDGLTLVAEDVPARVTSSRLFSEPADPHDANLRSTSEWGFTIPYDQPCEVSYTIKFGPGKAQSCIVGEVLQDDTWKTATRIWATRPKTATPGIILVLSRYDPDTDDFAELDPQEVQVVFDRVAPTQTPLRYAPAGRSSYQGGTLIGDLTFD